MKKNMKKVAVDDAQKDVDFEVISKVVMKSDNTYHVYKEDMNTEGIVAGGETPFPSDTKRVWAITDGDIDVDLAIKLALGVIEDKHTGERYLYHADDISERRENNEFLRLGIYYQLTHPEYDDRKLDNLLQQKGGKEYLKRLLLVDDYSIFDKLGEIFAKKKGVGGNLVEFRKKDV